jgi:hypothetical protein
MLLSSPADPAAQFVDMLVDAIEVRLPLRYGGVQD